MKKIEISKGPWKLRNLPRSESCFIEAPKNSKMAYGLDVCGDDYTGYGDEEQRNKNMQVMVATPEMYDLIFEIAERVLDANASLTEKKYYLEANKILKKIHGE